MRLRSDGGFASWGIALIAVAIFGGGLAILIKGAQGSVAREEKGAAPVAVHLDPITDHAPPTDERQLSCLTRVASSFGLTWSATDGWTSADYPRPTLSGSTGAAQIKADQARKTEWENDTRGRVNLAAADWASCLKLVDTPDQPDPPADDERRDWGGTWKLTSSRPPSERDVCPVPPYLIITLEVNGNFAQFHFEGKAPVRATAEGSYRFVAEDPAQNGMQVGVDLVRQSGKNVIVGRYADNGVEFKCDTNFTGERGSSDRP